ncbi:hypothetical protein ACG02S_10925 [Roseateles sp. DC23W]|uniref:Uncharacterized protein n=1 Tax=Pelomonas dachongensis TaxID=3299029 RepID=A0ABW7ENY7_9BURK
MIQLTDTCSLDGSLYEKLRLDGVRLAGGLASLTQRACVYHHIYKASGGRNVFPLIAAHGALWASGYFRKGMHAGKVLSFKFVFHPKMRAARLEALASFADKFRDINRRVCAESYAIYFASRSNAVDELLERRIGTSFLRLLKRCHAADDGASFSTNDRAALFNAFFDWEQQNIVAPAVKEAYDSFDWPIIKRLALTPNIDFAYFGAGYSLKFDDFSNTQERVHKGSLAYERAEAVGLDTVEKSLTHYGILQPDFLTDHNRVFAALLSAR